MFRNIYKLHKIGNVCHNKRLFFFEIIIKIFEKILFPACDIPLSVSIGEGAYFPHRAIGVVIHENCSIGKNVKIETNVVLGGKSGDGVPVVGDNCFFGTGSSVIGNVKIGNNCKIGAGAVVLNDIPDNSVAVGVPAKIIKTL